MKYQFLILNIIALLCTQNLNAATSGNCGPKSGSGTDEDPYVYASNCTYEYNADTKTLTISGEGKMADFTYNGNGGESIDSPWRDLGYETVVIGQGITRVGNFAFNGSKNLQNISLPESLTNTGIYAFGGTALTEIILPDKLKILHQGVFTGLNLSSITLPESLKSIEYRALQGTQITELVIPASVTNIDEKAFQASGNIGSPLAKIYCSAAQMTQCEAAVAYRGENVTIEEYQTDKNGRYFYKNHWYASANDIIGDNHIKKRIYTIDEANRVTGSTNTVRIRYR